MRTLTQRIEEKLLIFPSQVNEKLVIFPSQVNEKLVINKNYKSPYSYFDDVNELYLIRFNNVKSEKCIQIDIVNINKITIKDDKNCIVTGELILSNAHYLNCEFKYNSKNGILYRIVRSHYDVLLHQSLKDNFKKFVQEVFNDPDRTYFADEVFNILNIEFPELDNKFDAEYDYVETADNPIFMKKLVRQLNIK